jgi:hypothetical protein
VYFVLFACLGLFRLVSLPSSPSSASSSTASRLERIGAYVAYSLGMGAIIAVLSLAAAIWYGRWELDVYDGRLESDGVVETGENIRSWFITTIDGLGTGRIGAGLVIAVLAAFVLDRVSRGARAQPESSESQTTS